MKKIFEVTALSTISKWLKKQVGFLLFATLTVAIVTIGWQSYTRQAQEHARLSYQDFVDLYRSHLETLSAVAETIFRFEIDRPAVVALMAEAYDRPDRRDEIRKKLYTNLLPVYRYLERRGIRQLHFHLPDNVSFLRFHRPDYYGDSLRGIRPSIDTVDTTRKPVACFEEGRIFNGFRHVYPLFDHRRFVGTVEISFDASALINKFIKIARIETLFLIKRKAVDKKVWRFEKDNYKPSPLSPDYLIDIGTEKRIARHVLEAKRLNAVIRKAAPVIASPLHEERAESVAVTVRERTYLLHLLPVPNCRGEIVAYFIGIKPDPSLDHFKSIFLRYMLVLIGAIATVVALLQIYLTRQMRDREKLERQATTDALTGLLNRHGFKKIVPSLVAEAQRHGRNFSLIMFDIDHFKAINDEHGHDKGDEVLEEVAHFVQSRVRAGDLCIRWGGEEFIVITPDTNLEGALHLAETLRHEIETRRFGGLAIACSFGVVSLEENETLESLVQRADRALYRAKKRGRNRVETEEKRSVLSQTSDP